MDYFKLILEFGKAHGISALLFVIIVAIIIDLVRSSRKNVEDYYKTEVKEVKAQYATLQTSMNDLHKALNQILFRTQTDCPMFFKDAIKYLDDILDICKWSKEIHSKTDNSGKFLWYNSPEWVEKLNQVHLLMVDIQATLRKNKDEK